MTDAPCFNTGPHRTPSPSPGTTFAPPITPIILESSPLATGVARDSSPNARSCRSPFPKSPAASNAPGAARGKSSRHGNGLGFTKKGTALAESRGRENLALSRGRQTVDEGEIGCIALPASDCFSPTRRSSTANQVLQVDGKQGIVNGKKKTKTVRGQKRGSASVDKIIGGQATKASVDTGRSRTSDTDDCIPLSIAERTKNKRSLDTTDLQLAEATTRRTQWTPPKNSALTAIDLTDSPLISQAATPNNFGDLVSQYGFGKPNVLEQSVGSIAEAPTKKRRLEPVEADNRISVPLSEQTGDAAPTSKPQKNVSAQRSSTKAKNSRKSKPATITSLTTAPYDTRDATLIDYMSPKRSDKHPTKKTSTKPRATKSSKTKKGTSKKAEDPPVFKVAPPVDSLKSLDDQVLLFGTCSQLARDSSPGLAVPRKPETASQLLDHPSENPSKSDSRQRPSKLSVSKNLWSASSRDLNDKLADIEVVDLESPGTSNSSHASEKSHGLSQTKGSSVDIVGLPHRSASAGCTAREEDDEKRSVVGNCGKNEPHTGGNSTSIPDPAVKQLGTADLEADGHQMPHYRGFSTAELAEQIAAFGFKPIKNRNKAVSLLERCWESQHKKSVRAVAPSNSTEEPVVSASAAADGAEASALNTTFPPKTVKETKDSTKTQTRAGSKSCKNRTKTTEQRQINQPNESISNSSGQLSVSASIPEVADSTDEDSNPAPSNQPDPSPIPPLAATVSNNPAKSADRNPERTPEIAKQITLAVQMQPRMHEVNGTKQPTWYEKILMYDPICLDDLTVWLNTQGLGRIGEDSEVNRLTVREWCESKGVCCTWRKAGPGNP